MLLGLVFLALSVSDTAGVGTPWFLLTLWWIWAVMVVERVVAVHIVTSRLKRAPGSVHDTRLPWHRKLDRYARKIVVEQNQAPVFYSGYVPFVGAGTLSRSWSFSVALRAANPSAPTGGFTSDELVDHVCRQVIGQLRTRVAAAQRIDGLTVTARFYSTLLRPSGFDASTAVGGDSAGAADDYGAARRYACISISSWDQELVTSIFVGFDIRGDTLHTELHSYVLPPIKAEYHEVDRLPETFSVPDVLTIAAASPIQTLFRWFVRKTMRSSAGSARPSRTPSLFVVAGFILAFLPSILVSLLLISGFQSGRIVWLVAGFLVLWIGPAILGPLMRRYRRWAEERSASQHRIRTELVGGNGRTIVDYGARTSIRELAASDAPHHFFQSADQDKYTKIIERRVTDFIIDFLRARNVDVGEFETRQQVVLNYGVMQTGDGQITNSGSIAVGMSTATVTGVG